MKWLLFLLTFVLAVSCDSLRSDDDAAKVAATRWAEAYFGCDFHEAEEYCTPESEQWLRFAASNTTQADLDLLAEQDVEAEAGDSFSQANDTMRTVAIKVCNYLKPEVIGAKSSIVKEGTFNVTLVKRNGKWLVKMANLPRSEKQSRD